MNLPASPKLWTLDCLVNACKMQIDSAAMRHPEPIGGMLADLGSTSSPSGKWRIAMDIIAAVQAREAEKQ